MLKKEQRYEGRTTCFFTTLFLLPKNSILIEPRIIAQTSKCFFVQPYKIIINLRKCNILLFESNFSLPKKINNLYSTFIQPLFDFRKIAIKEKPRQTTKKWLSDAAFALVEITGLEPVTS